MSTEDRNQLYNDLHNLRTNPQIGYDARIRLEKLLADYRESLERDNESGKITIFNRLPLAGQVLVALTNS